MKIELIAVEAVQGVAGHGRKIHPHDGFLARVRIADLKDAQGIHRNVRAGTEFAAYAFDRPGQHPRAFWNHLPRRDGPIDRVEAHDGRARQRPQVIGPQQLQQGMRQFRKIVLDLQAQLGGKKGKPFQ
ncbi:hypothetical protein D3C72_2092650 [compost metagenome]